MYQIYLYKTSSGRRIIADFIKSLEEVDRDRIRTGIRILKEHGLTLLKTKWMKKIYHSPDIYELRITGRNEVRLLLIRYKISFFLIIHAFVKKTQKIPKQELTLAIKRTKEFV